MEHIGYFLYTEEGHGIYLNGREDKFESSLYAAPDFLTFSELEIFKEFVKEEVGDFFIQEVYAETAISWHHKKENTLP